MNCKLLVCAGQDFRKIATFLPNRDTGDCVMHFYRVQKLDEFASVRRKQQLKKRRQQSEFNRQTTYLGMGVLPSARIAEPSPPAPSEFLLFAFYPVASFWKEKGGQAFMVEMRN